MVKEIKFEHMCGLRNSSEGAENVKIQAYKKLKFTDFQLVNNYNPKIKFSVLIDENEDKYINLQGTRLPYFDAVIKRID
ncbi:unnamed protein product [Meloidogyne enterolobii]|uniref:Uncharacterized protein n=1 Tax=Meloidogyne enterolobii TaxID=390850 RepID=A0ACB1A037_MELEN